MKNILFVIGKIYMWIATIFLSLILITGVTYWKAPSALTMAYILYQNTQEVTRFEVIGEEVHMHNEINSKTLKQFEKVLEQNPQVTTLVEHVVPGSMDDDTMIPLSYLVREMGLNTKLLANSAIDSGGVDLFLSGVERIIELKEDGTYPHIGVHSWANGMKQATDYPKDAPEHEQNRKYIEIMLGQDDFYWFTIHAAPANDIHEMSAEEIQKYNLATQVVPYGSFSQGDSSAIRERVNIRKRVSSRSISAAVDEIESLINPGDLEGRYDENMDYFVSDNGKYLFMNGTINSGFPDDLHDIFEHYTDLSWVVLLNVPGSMDDYANLEGSLMVRDAGLNTYVPKGGMVASGGTDLFIAGVERVASHNAMLGVHSWASQDENGKMLEGKDFPRDHEQHKLYLNYYKEMGVPADFYWFTLEAANANNIYEMKQKEMRRYKVATQIMPN